jgi:thiol-disulfide isomerase/thioredoxin
MRVVRTVSLLAVVLFLVMSSNVVFGQLVTVAPQSPKINDDITVTYDPGARNAAIQRPSSLTVRTLVLRDVGSSPVLVETPMAKSGRMWKASFKLQQADARFLLHQFVAGDLKDDNAEKGWSTMVVGADGKTLRAAHYWRAAVLAFGGYMGYKFQKDVPAAKAELALERKMYPEDYSAVNLAWYLETNPTPTEAGTARVKKELGNALRLFRKNDDALPMILVWFDQVGEQKKADSLRKVFIAENPRGKVAAATHIMGLSTEHDPAKKIRLLEQHVSGFNLKEEETLADKRQLVLLYAQTGDFDKGYGVLKSSPNSDPALYKNVVAPMIEKGNGLDKALTWITEGIDILRKQDEVSKPPSIPLDDWKQSHAVTLASLLQVRGQVSSKSGKKDQAEADFAEAYALTKGADLSINLNFVDAYLATNKNPNAVDIGLECIRKGRSNLAIIEKFKAAFKNVHGSLAGYDKAVQQAKTAEQTQMLKSGLNKPAPDFSLKDLDGATLNLSEMRGKVVVVNFWATWGSGCKEALAQLQKVYEAYQYYRTVSFVTINTTENAAGAARDALVKKSMAGMKCTIPVGLDEVPGMAEKYGIEGIPITYVIDKNGKIQFKHIGFKDGTALVNDLENEIEVLLKH